MNHPNAEKKWSAVLKSLHRSVREKSYQDAYQFANKILANESFYPFSIVDYAKIIVESYRTKIHKPFHLSINPSYATAQEVDFWNRIHDEVRTNAAPQIKELRFRNFGKNTLKKDSLVHPARLADLSNFFSKNYRYSVSSLPNWITADDVELHIDWEHRRWQINKYDPRVEKGFVQLCWHIDSFINNTECISVITSNKLDHPNRLGFLASQILGKPYTFVERSPFMGHLVEPRGMFSESKLKDFLINSRDHIDAINSEELNSAKSILIDNIYGFRLQEAKPIDIDEQLAPFLFLPLDNLIWTGWEPVGHPQGRIDYPHFWNINKLLTLISEFSKANGLRVIVKPHPSCKEYPRLAKAFPSIAFELDKDLASLINHAKVIVCGLTKVAFNAAALGKHVITVGENPANFLPNVHSCVDESSLIAKMKDVMHDSLQSDTSSVENILDRIKAYYTLSESKFLNHISSPPRMTNRASVTTPTTYNLKVKTCKDDLAKRITAAINSQRIPVLFDISRLININLLHSGISKFTLTLYRELCDISEVDVIPYINFLQKSKDGLSAYELHSTLEALAVDYAYHTGRVQLELIEEKFIYMSPHWGLPPVSRQAQRVITVHDVLHLTESFYEASNVRKVTQEIINSIKPKDRIVSVSGFSKTELQRIRPDLDKVSVVNLPPILNRLVAGSRSEVRESIRALATKLRRMYILIPVQGDPRKRLDMMVDVAATAVAKSNGLQCIFFGRKSFESLLMSTLIDRGLNMGNNCHFVSAPSDHELVYLYQNALTTLYLSDSEGYGLPPLEALSAGCLPIARMITGLKDSLQGYVHGLDASASTQDIYNKILEFKNMSPTKYREEVMLNQGMMSQQLGINLGEEYYNVFRDAWQSCNPG